MVLPGQSTYKELVLCIFEPIDVLKLQLIAFEDIEAFISGHCYKQGKYLLAPVNLCPFVPQFKVNIMHNPFGELDILQETICKKLQFVQMLPIGRLKTPYQYLVISNKLYHTNPLTKITATTIGARYFILK